MKRQVHAGMGVGLLMGLALAGAVHAQDTAGSRWEIQGGPSVMDSHATAAVFVDGIGAARPLGQTFTWAPEGLLGYIDGRSIDRYRTSNPGVTDNVVLGALGARFRLNRDDWAQHLFFSFQAAAHTGRTQALSSGYEFVSTLGWTQRWWSVQVRHISNGGFHDPNRGETSLLLGVALKP